MVYSLSQNTIYSTRRASFILPAEHALRHSPCRKAENSLTGPLSSARRQDLGRGHRPLEANGWQLGEDGKGRATRDPCRHKDLKPTLQSLVYCLRFSRLKFHANSLIHPALEKFRYLTSNSHTSLLLTSNSWAFRNIILDTWIVSIWWISPPFHDFDIPAIAAVS